MKASGHRGRRSPPKRKGKAPRRQPSVKTKSAAAPSKRRPIEGASLARAPAPRSGTLSTQDDAGRLPEVESGLPVVPEELGRHFLSSATEQDNFESELDSDDPDPAARRLGDLVSESTLESAGQEDVEIPESTALTDAPGEAEPDAPSSDVDLSKDSVREGSLLDRVVEDSDEAEVQEPTTARTDDLVQFQSGPAIDEDERRKEMARTRARLREGRGGRPRAPLLRKARSRTP